MIAPDAVHYRRVLPRSVKWQIAAAAILCIPLFIYLWVTDPPNRPWGVVTLSALSLVVLGQWKSAWLEPSEGVVVMRYWRRYESRHRLAIDTRVRLRTYFVLPGPYVLLNVRPAESRKIGAVVPLLLHVDDEWVGPDAARIRLLADTLQWHCPTAAPDVITTLHAHADHLDAGLPVDDSPLGRMLGGGSAPGVDTDVTSRPPSAPPPPPGVVDDRHA